MTGHRIALMAGALVALSFGHGWAAEGMEAHTAHAPKTIILDNERLQPADLEMAASDSVVFENHSVHPISVTFTEPSDVADKIRCGLVRKSAKEKVQVPWQLFAWNDGKLTATIPPGRFASVCSLQPGSYAYVANRQNTGVRAGRSGGLLPDKGQITVR